MTRTWKWTLSYVAAGAAILQIQLGGWQTSAMLPMLAAIVVLAWREGEPSATLIKRRWLSPWAKRRLKRRWEREYAAHSKATVVMGGREGGDWEVPIVRKEPDPPPAGGC